MLFKPKLILFIRTWRVTIYLNFNNTRILILLLFLLFLYISRFFTMENIFRALSMFVLVIQVQIFKNTMKNMSNMIFIAFNTLIFYVGWHLHIVCLLCFYSLFLYFTGACFCCWMVKNVIICIFLTFSGYTAFTKCK